MSSLRLSLARLRKTNFLKAYNHRVWVHLQIGAGDLTNLININSFLLKLFPSCPDSARQDSSGREELWEVT